MSRDYRTMALAGKSRPQKAILPGTPVSNKASSTLDINKISRTSTATVHHDITDEPPLLESAEQSVLTPTISVSVK